MRGFERALRAWERRLRQDEHMVWSYTRPEGNPTGPAVLAIGLEEMGTISPCTGLCTKNHAKRKLVSEADRQELEVAASLCELHEMRHAAAALRLFSLDRVK